MPPKPAWNPYGGLSDEEDDCSSKQASTSGAFSTAFAATAAAAAASPQAQQAGIDIGTSIRLVHYMDSSLRASIALIPDSPATTPYTKAAVKVLDEWDRLEKVHAQSDDRRDMLKGTYIGIVMVQTLVMVLDAMMKHNDGKDVNFLVGRSMRALAGGMQSRLHPIPAA